ncbi:hypothetical protein ACTFIV_002171 [Dictyostelium citrinum]
MLYKQLISSNNVEKSIINIKQSNSLNNYNSTNEISMLIKRKLHQKGFDTLSPELPYLILPSSHIVNLNCFSFQKNQKGFIVFDSTSHSAKLDRANCQSFEFHVDSEKPSKLRTRLLKKKQMENEVLSIYTPNGSTTTDQTEIRECFRLYYEKLFNSIPDNPKIHKLMLKNWKINKDDKWKNLDTPFSLEELKSAIKDTHPNKAPGPDGLTNLLYINLLDHIAPTLLIAYNDLLSNPTNINTHFITGYMITLFKSGDPLDIGNRRPITLLNCDLKFLSKMINNRIIKISELIINKNQKGFVPGRFIIDNIITINEVINYLNKSNQNGILTLYDFAKAFDSISHNSIERTLLHIGIPAKLTNLIMALLKDSTAKVIVNGTPSNSFEIKRGVKQGDPLSPTLFVLVAECLASAINNDTNISGLQLNDSNQREKFQAFADDSLTLARNYKEQALLMVHFEHFSQATSSKLNKHKSASIVIGIISDKLWYTPEIEESKTDERYLGYFFTNNGITRKLPKILNSIKQSLILWKDSGTTLKTKMTILKSYTLASLIYHSYIEEFSQEEINQINSIIKWFLSSPNQSNKIDTNSKTTNLMSNSRAFFPLSKGGWGLWDIKKRQDAQKIWIYNRFLSDINNNKILSAYYNMTLKEETPSLDFTQDVSPLTTCTITHALSVTQTWKTTLTATYSWIAQKQENS